MYQNITLDFTIKATVEGLTAGQPLAIMPADLAQRLLMSYASQLKYADITDIIGAYADDLKMSRTIGEAITKSLSFIQERQLIDNINAGNWDSYTVQRP